MSLDITKNDIRHICIRLLSQREHSYQELVYKLSLRGITADLAEPVLEELSKEGLQSDSRFAEVYTRSQILKLYGPMKVQQALSQKGIKHCDIDEILVQAGYFDWSQLAAEALVRKYANVALDDKKKLAKCMRGLQQRGFTMEQIKQAIQNL